MKEAEDAGRQRPATNSLDDIEVDVARLVFGPGIVLTVVLASVICVGATASFAYRYSDRWLWLMASVMAILCAFRIGVVFAFLVKDASKLTSAAAYRWHLAYGLSVIGYTSIVGLVNGIQLSAPRFRVHAGVHGGDLRVLRRCQYAARLASVDGECQRIDHAGITCSCRPVAAPAVDAADHPADRRLRLRLL